MYSILTLYMQCRCLPLVSVSWYVRCNAWWSWQEWSVEENGWTVELTVHRPVSKEGHTTPQKISFLIDILRLQQTVVVDSSIKNFFVVWTNYINSDSTSTNGSISTTRSIATNISISTNRFISTNRSKQAYLNKYVNLNK